MRQVVMALLLGGLASLAHAETISGLCMVSAHTKAQAVDTAEVMLRESNCDDEGHGCGNSNHSGIAWSRWTGVSPETLKQEGVKLDARMRGEAGELRCEGTVHEGVLAGRYEFTPNAAFTQTMAAMGFEEMTPHKQEAFLMLDITTAWAKQMKDAGVTELSTNKLIGLRALHVDTEYIHAMSAAGYPELRANKLTEMKAVGVTPEKVRDAKAMGFQPTEQELIQMSIFKIDRPFVDRMKAKGLKDLTVAKLVKIKIFKLDQ